MPRPRLNSRPPAALSRQLHTRPPLDRMQQIFQAIKSGEFPNRHRLAADIEVTTKTIQRDSDFMRERLGLPIAYDQEGDSLNATKTANERFLQAEKCREKIHRCGAQRDGTARDKSRMIQPTCRSLCASAVL